MSFQLALSDTRRNAHQLAFSERELHVPEFQLFQIAKPQGSKVFGANVRRADDAELFKARKDIKSVPPPAVVFDRCLSYVSQPEISPSVDLCVPEADDLVSFKEMSSYRLKASGHSRKSRLYRAI